MRIDSGWRLLGRHLRPRSRALRRVAVWTAVESLPALASGLLVAAALDRGFLVGRPGIGLGWLALLGMSLGIRAFAARQLYPWLGEVVEPLRDGLVTDVVAAAIGRGLVEGERTDMTDVARLTEQVETVRQLVSALLRTLRQFGMSIIASLAGIAALAPEVGLLVGPLVLAALVLYACSLRSLSARQRNAVLADEAIAQTCGPLLAGLRDVIACGAEAHAATTIGQVIDRQADAEQALARAGTIRTLIIALGGQLPVLAILAAAPWLMSRHHLSVGAMAGAIVYLTTSLEPTLRSLVHLAGSWGLGLAVTSHRLAEVCVPSPRPVPAPSSGLVLPGEDLDIRGLTFAYSPDAEPVVANLNLTLVHGEHLAVVGPSGSGKSTLANLLARLIHPQGGQIRLGGLPLEDVEEGRLHRTIALIPQQAYVFAGTLRENLAYLHSDATDAELDTAAVAVGLEPVIERLGGYDTQLGPGGVILSEGERQLVALARVYLSPATIVILDEATCYLDPVAEAQAERSFANRDNTLIVVAHRISSAQRARRILLMDGATPVLGTHEELVAHSVLYANLVGHWQTPSQCHNQMAHPTTGQPVA